MSEYKCSTCHQVLPVLLPIPAQPMVAPIHPETKPAEQAAQPVVPEEQKQTRKKVRRTDYSHGFCYKITWEDARRDFKDPEDYKKYANMVRLASKLRNFTS